MRKRRRAPRSQTRHTRNAQASTASSNHAASAGRDVEIEKDLEQPLLFARELPHLQVARVRAGLPVHVARAFERLVGAYAVEVAAPAARLRFEIAAHGGQHLLEAGLRVDGRIDQHIAAQRHVRAALDEAERKARGKLEAALAVDAAPAEADLHGFVEHRAARDHGKVKRR